MDIEQTLTERNSNYGDFAVHAQITQELKIVMRNTPNWKKLSYDKKEALEMLAHKLGRILNGNSELHDSWFDCVGYITLVIRNLKK